MAPKNSVWITERRFFVFFSAVHVGLLSSRGSSRKINRRKKNGSWTNPSPHPLPPSPHHPPLQPGSFHQQHSPVFCVAKRMTRATMMMKSKETMAMRQISREVQRGFLADLGAVVSVILGSLPSGTSCRPVSSPGEQKREVDSGGGKWLRQSTVVERLFHILSPRFPDS